MGKTRKAGFNKRRRRGGRGKSRRGGRCKSKRGGNNSLLKNSLLKLVNSSEFDKFAAFTKKNGVTITKAAIIAKISSVDDGQLNKTLKEVLGKICTQKGGTPPVVRHEFRIDSPMFNPSSLFNCILWAVVLLHMNRTILLGIWLGICTGAGGIRF